MAETADADQKTQAASAKRKRDAAAKGDVLQSRELGTALVMLAGAVWLILAGPWSGAVLAAMVRAALVIGPRDLDRFDPAARAVGSLLHAVGPIALLFAMTIVAAIAGPALLGALGFRSGGYAPKLSKLDPLRGIARMFGAQGAIELAKSLGKVMLLGTLGWWLLAARLPAIVALSAADSHAAASAIGTQFAMVALWLALGLGAIGLVDAPVQAIRRNARLRMTLHEVKEESKESEGSPETKAMARRQRHEILQGSARRAVSEATVILTNPTHFAIALRYRPGIDALPIVVARGRGETALAIRALAHAATVPQLEYPQLTRALYFTTRAGQPISSDLYLAVATILAFVFNLDRAIADGIAPPTIAVPPTKSFDARGHRTG